MSSSRVPLPLRVAILLTLFPVLLAGLLGYVLLDVQHEQVEHALRSHYEAGARCLAIDFPRGARPGQSGQIEEILAVFSEDENVVEVSIQEPGGAIRRADGPAAEHDLALGAIDTDAGELKIEEVGPEPGGVFHSEGHLISVVAPIESGGAVRIVFTTRNANQEVTETARWSLAILGAGLLVGIVFAWRFDRRVRRIVHDLAAAAGQIAGGSLEQRVQIQTGDEDLERLARTINQLAADLVVTRGELDQRNLRLSELLDSRTKALRLAEDLAAHHEEMAEAGVLAAGLAHEIANPLASISGVAQRFVQDEPDPERRRRIERILGLVDRIERVLRGLKEFALSEDHAAAEVDPFELARQAMDLVREHPRASVVDLRIEAPGEPCRVRAPADRLGQVFVNLIINAVESIENQGTVTVRGAAVGGEIRVDVADTGIGMADEVARHIFNPFFTTRRSNRPGVGLGLAISYGIVRRLGGRIEVESAPGAGSTFSVYLPAAAGGRR